MMSLRVVRFLYLLRICHESCSFPCSFWSSWIRSVHMCDRFWDSASNSYWLMIHVTQLVTLLVVTRVLTTIRHYVSSNSCLRSVSLFGLRPPLTRSSITYSPILYYYSSDFHVQKITRIVHLYGHDPPFDALKRRGFSSSFFSGFTMDRLRYSMSMFFHISAFLLHETLLSLSWISTPHKDDKYDFSVLMSFTFTVILGYGSPKSKSPRMILIFFESILTSW